VSVAAVSVAAVSVLDASVDVASVVAAVFGGATVSWYAVGAVGAVDASSVPAA
jgi:hypothetical protein